MRIGQNTMREITGWNAVWMRYDDEMQCGEVGYDADRISYGANLAGWGSMRSDVDGMRCASDRKRCG